MRKISSLLLALGAGLAVYRWFDQRQRQEKALAWHRAQLGTALVTGASSGIGAAFARALAHEGYDLILVARREDRLRALAEEIRAGCPVQVEVLVADLDSPDDLKRVANRIQAVAGLDLLVNNAGFGVASDYATADVEEVQRMVRVMVLASMRLARAALPGMLARGRGGLIQVSSLAAFLPVGGNAVYGATKAYLNFFSESLANELDGTGVRVQALCPGFTHTEIHDKGGRPNLPGFLWLQPDAVVEESLQGLREGRLYVVPGTFYRLGYALARLPLIRPLIRLVRSRAVGRLPEAPAPEPPLG